MLKFDHVSFGYGDEGAISDVSFEIKAGEFVALLGENGAGKSTLCRLANGLLKPSSGTVIAGEHDTRRVKTSVIARSIGFLFQNPDRQLCRNTVREEISLGLLSDMSDRAEARRRCDEMLALFSLDGNRDPFSMSRGERQQAALASVLASRPRLLILDEPTTGLDYRERGKTMEIISRLNGEGTTILMISHDMEITADFARRALVLSHGKLLADGGIREIMRDRLLLETASLLPAQMPALAMMLLDQEGAAWPGSALKFGKNDDSAPDALDLLDVFTLDDMLSFASRMSSLRKAAGL
jgi:energy-coupling factor transport system ATP-binding protein